MQTSSPQLQQKLGVLGATMMGLGSILGTGVFVSIGIAVGIAGPAVILAVAIGGLVAICNGLNSAQLAANHPVSGGTYEYGYKYLTPWLGFTAGWMFLVAKTASAATAALGFAGYLLNATGSEQNLIVSTALAAVVLFTLIVLGGIQRSNIANIVIVLIALLSLGFFAIAGLPVLAAAGLSNFTPFFQTPNAESGDPVGAVLHASALMFVAYTGYGRIATLGEEVREPRRNIPRAIIITMMLTMLLYITVAIVSVGSVGAAALSPATGVKAAPLEIAARSFGITGSAQILSVGAIAAMLGVLLNLILGLSRVLLAMGRRRDMPGFMARLNKAGTTPYWAVVVVGVAIGGLVLTGNVKTTWSFSAFTVLIYYAITNLAALRLPAEARLYPKWLAWLGLLACLFLSFWVEQQIWLTGLGLIIAGLIWHKLMHS